jgi:hypothetical protein
MTRSATAVSEVRHESAANSLLCPPRDKYLIAASINKDSEIGTLAATGVEFADLMASCRRLVSDYVTLAKQNDSQPLSENDAYRELLSGSVQFFERTGRTILSLTDFITDVPEILAHRGLVATLRC